MSPAKAAPGLDYIDAALQCCDLLNGLPHSFVSDLRRTSRRSRYSSGQLIVRAGVVADRMHILLQGRAKAVALDGRGTETILWVGPGHLMGLSVLCATPLANPLDFEALSECETLQWPRAEIIAIGNRCPRLLENAVTIACTRLSLLASSYHAINSYSVDKRLAWTLSYLSNNFPEPTSEGESHVDLLVSNDELASMLGCSSTAFTVSRILRRWERAGLVEKRGRHMRIFSIERLRSFCAASTTSALAILCSLLAPLSGNVVF